MEEKTVSVGAIKVVDALVKANAPNLTIVEILEDVYNFKWFYKFTNDLNIN